MTFARSLILACAVVPAVALADVKVDSAGCAGGVHLQATDASLSEVLGELSVKLKFELKFAGDDSRRINMDTTRKPSELISKLMEGGSVVTDDAPDPNCPGQTRLKKVWVLPKGQEAPAAATAPAPSPMDMYRKAHGLPPEDPKPAAKVPPSDR